jgi:hypothetical protein
MHALLVIVTLGVWIIPWLVITMNWMCRIPWRCRTCRRRFHPRAVATPNSLPTTEALIPRF